MVSMIRNFFKLEAAGGLLLLICAVMAIVVVNSPLGAIYDHILHVHFVVQLASFKIDMTLHHWINDALMAVFFLLIGLEIKREIQEGELSSMSQIALPGIAAIGGMVLPALIFVAFNYSDPESIKGWAIPAATDIAFALGILTLCGKGVPISLKVFLTALAIFDDLGAIIIIALFYSGDLSIPALVGSALAVVALTALNLSKVRSLVPYMLVGAVLWVLVLKSGVHATLAGVLLGLCIPGKGAGEHSPLKHLEHGMHSWVVFGILPVFGFANAGVDLSGASFDSLLNPVALGVCLGLFLGKQIGIFGFCWLAIKAGIAEMPKNGSWFKLYGVSALAGIGFTMSLFIGNLAYGAGELMEASKMGILMGSFLAGTVGFYMVKIGIKSTGTATYSSDVVSDLRILVAEGLSADGHAIKLSEALSLQGINVKTSADASQLVEMAKDDTFDLIFLDLDIPMQDCLAAINDLREAAKHNKISIPIFATSGNGDNGVEGIDRIFTKGDIDRDKLKKEIEQIATGH
jgi:NhaA family Na+:H+ antiporter